jgi:hypothetical protein
MLWDPLAVLPAWRRWLWAVLAVLACVLQGPAFVDSLRPPRTEWVDFFQDWASARNFLEGLPVYTHQKITLERYLELGPDKVFTFIEHNAHPPPSVLLALPFAGLDCPEATLAWNLISLTALAVSLVLVGHAMGLGFSLWYMCPAVTLLLICNPLLQQVNQGQLSLLLALLVTGTWVAERSGRRMLAGVLLGTATAAKIFPGFLFLYFLLRRQWLVIAAGACAFAAITGLTLVLLGPQTYADYIKEAMPHLAQYRSDWLNASLVGFWCKLFDAGTGESAKHVRVLWPSQALAWLGILLSCGLVLAWWARRVWRSHQESGVGSRESGVRSQESGVRSQRSGDHAFGLSVIVMLLVAPITWEHYFLLLIVPLALTWQALPAADWARAVFLVILACLWINPALLWEAFIADTEGLQRGVASPWQTVTLLSFQCYALLGLFVFCYWLFDRSPDKLPTTKKERT